jgi:hypothetical protein
MYLPEIHGDQTTLAELTIQEVRISCFFLMLPDRQRSVYFLMPLTVLYPRLMLNFLPSTSATFSKEEREWGRPLPIGIIKTC